MAQRRGLKVGLTGFAIALVGAVAGFGGFEIDQRWLSLTGFGITAAGVMVGFIGIVYGWITEGKQAVTGSFKAARELRNKIVAPGSKNNNQGQTPIK